jgi:dihydrolipoamide dehydrogenase
MPRRSVDVAVVGAGTAGLAAYDAAVAVTKRVALIDAGPLGTLCARVGCMPSKLLIAAADAAHDARHAEQFGVTASVRVDGRRVMERLHRERDRFVDGVLARMDRIPPGDLIRGTARFTSPGVLDVGGETIEARAVVIATGAAPVVPAMFASLGDRLVLSDDVFAWTVLPDSVAVFGCGPLGLEIGQALHRLGVRVHLFGKGEALGVLSDPVVRTAAGEALRSEMTIDLNASVRSVRRDEAGVVVAFDDDRGAAHMESFALALVATGRRPHLAGLALEHADVALDADGAARVNRETMQCGHAALFLAGDASRGIPVEHEAVDEGAIAGENAARYPDVRPRPRRSALQVTFCDPQLAVIGASYEQLLHGSGVVVGEVRFEDQGRSRVTGKNRGVGRLYAEGQSGRLLGAEMAGPSVEHLAHLLAWAHQLGLTIDQMLALPLYHPVIEEGLRTALRDARRAPPSPSK